MVLRADWAGREDSGELQVDMVWRCLSGLTGLGGMFGCPWYFQKLLPTRNELVGSRSVLGDDIAHVLDTAKIPFFVLTQRADIDQASRAAYGWLWISIANPAGLAGAVVNSAILHIEAGTSPDGGIPFEWVIRSGPGLVELFVDAWNPDSVSLTDLDLQGSIDDVDEPWIYARPGYFLWLADHILPAAEMPHTPYRQRYGTGTIIGVDQALPASARQTADLIDWNPIYDCNTNPLENN